MLQFSFVSRRGQDCFRIATKSDLKNRVGAARRPSHAQRRISMPISVFDCILFAI
jgi:hypothetical protein